MGSMQMLPLDSKSNPTAENKELIAAKFVRTSKPKSTRKYMDSEEDRLNVNNKKDDFDIILQDLDDLIPLNDMKPLTKTIKNDPTKKKMMLRSTRVKFDIDSNTRTNLPSFNKTVVVDRKAE